MCVPGWVGQSRIIKIQSRNSYFSYNGCIRNLAEMPFFMYMNLLEIFVLLLK